MLSLWRTITPSKYTYPSLKDDIEVDVIIVGGGITGVTAANQLITAGKKVAVIEAQKMGGITTSSSTGNLYVPVQPLYQSIENKFNLETAKTVAQSRQLAIDYIESIVKQYKITCHFKKRPLYAYSNQVKNCFLLKEIELWKTMNLEVENVRELPFNLPFKQAVMMPNQARFNPLKYVISLAGELHKRGCHLFENTRALEINEKPHHCIVVTEHAKVIAKQILIATHTPIGINPTQFYTAPYRSYVVAVTLKDKHYPEGHFWDMDKPTHALCTHPLTHIYPELLMVAGSHHKTGQGSNMNGHFKELLDFLKKHFDVDEIPYQWSAQHYHAADNIPYIGLAYPSAKYTYMATGYFADGLVYGTLAGIILGDLLGGKENEFFHTYKTNRKDFWKSSSFLFKEGSNQLLQYLKDLPLFKHHHYNDLKRGEGKVVEINRIKYAVSRNEKNQLQIVSAICPHMKGIVAWNNAEQTWDCPLHGSRFTPAGEIIEGPAMCPLSGKDDESLKEDR